MDILHPVSKMPFPVLMAGLKIELDKGNITCKTNGKLKLWTYTNSCVYDSNWNIYTTIARGLITNNKRIVALPFPKFFNLSENLTILPDLPFSVYEKLDGSLIITYHYKGKWHCATKGSFNSEQAQRAEQILPKLPNKDVTYLFELVGPSNKIVISYPEDKLIFLGAYNNKTCLEMNPQNFGDDPMDVARWVGYSQNYDIGNYLDFISEQAKSLPSNEEGYVIRFDNGTRVKVKGDEYLLLHRMISNITPLAIWEEMLDNEFAAWDKIKEIPEEFRKDYEIIFHILLGKLKNCVKEVGDFYYETQHLTDKELGLMLPELNPLIRKLIFPRRKNATILTGKTRQALFQFFRPTGNKLEGYTPSNSMNRVVEES